MNRKYLPDQATTSRQCGKVVFFKQPNKKEKKTNVFSYYK